MRTNKINIIKAFIILMIILNSSLYSHNDTISYRVLDYYMHSGIYNGDGIKHKEVFNTKVTFDSAHWFRVFFRKVNLGVESYIIIRSLYDDYYQKLNSETILQWKLTSAYFNGNSFEISLYVGPDDQNIFFEIYKIVYSIGEGDYQYKSICGLNDGRSPSSKKAVGRINGNRGIGTAWILNNGKLVTALHCLSCTIIHIKSKLLDWNFSIYHLRGTFFTHLTVSRAIKSSSFVGIT